MFGFGKRQGGGVDRLELARLSTAVAKLESTVRQLDTEQVMLHDQVRKWMRRAVAAERAVERNQERIPTAQLPLVAAPQLTGIRARIAARRARRARAVEMHMNGGAEASEAEGDDGPDS